MHPYAYGSIIHNSQDIRVPTDKWMDVEDVIHICKYNEVLLSHKKKIKSCYLWHWNILWFHLHVESNKYSKWTKITKQKQTFIQREWTGDGRREGVMGGWVK